MQVVCDSLSLAPLRFGDRWLTRLADGKDLKRTAITNQQFQPKACRNLARSH